MTWLRTSFVFLFLCCGIIVMCIAEDLPMSFMDFTAFFNGHFDNKEEARKRYSLYDSINIISKPSLAPSLTEGPVLYGEEAVNGTIYRRWVEVRNESSTDYKLVVTYYTFTDPNNSKPGAFNTDRLFNMARDEFKSEDICYVTVRKLFEEAILALVTDCRNVVNGKHPVYNIVLSCYDYRLIVPSGAFERATPVPYILRQRGPRYPLIGAADGYVNPCHDGV